MKAGGTLARGRIALSRNEAQGQRDQQGNQRHRRHRSNSLHLICSCLGWSPPPPPPRPRERGRFTGYSFSRLTVLPRPAAGRLPDLQVPAVRATAGETADLVVEDHVVHGLADQDPVGLTVDHFGQGVEVGELGARVVERPFLAHVVEVEDGDEVVTQALRGSGELGGSAGGRGLGQDVDLADGDGALNVDDHAVDAGIETGDQHTPRR